MTFPKFNRGEKLTADKLNAFAAAAEALMLTNGLNSLVSNSGQGQTIRPRTASPSVSAAHPFRVSRIATPGYVRVAYGLVNELVPQLEGRNLGVKLAGVLPKLAVTSNGVVYIRITLDGSKVATAAAVEFAASLPAVTSGAYCTTIAAIQNWESDTNFEVAQAVKWSLGFQFCDPAYNVWGK